MLDFDATFQALTGNPPFPWQRELYALFLKGGDAIPQACDLPTGLGKTSVIPIWLIALAQTRANGVPRRLVYVVNRRTVVDQATREAENLREKLEAVDKDASLDRLRNELENLCAVEKNPPLAISTLRGQFADNREWSRDPARPAVIVGTVDMIGSRLLFSGYGCGFRTRPLHAGFLGQDALLVHDEAHLEKPFQDLLIAIEEEQNSTQPDGTRKSRDFCPLRVMELTATSRDGQKGFGLTEADYQHSIVQQRINAKKHLVIQPPVADAKKVTARIAELAHERGEEQRDSRIIVFVRTVEAVGEVRTLLRKKGVPDGNASSLTGTMRGLERDQLVGTALFRRFLPSSKRDGNSEQIDGTVYLVCTSAGEVGIDISADHLVCDLTPYDSMAQRFGRVNRFGDGDARIDVVYEEDRKEKGKNLDYEARRWLTLDLLRALNGDASPAALSKLDPKRREVAFTPTPTILPTSDILFDAWALTTIARPLVKEPLPGRPEVAEYLHGIEDEKQFRTSVTWRQEAWHLRKAGLSDDKLTELINEYPLKPHELLSDATFRKKTGVLDQLAKLAARHPDYPVWVQEPRGGVSATTLEKLTNPKTLLANRTVILPPEAGGLAIADGVSAGLLDGDAPYDEERRHLYDVADELKDDAGVPLRWHGPTEGNSPPPEGMRRAVAAVPLRPETDEDEPAGGSSAEVADAGTATHFQFFVQKQVVDDDISKLARLPVRWKAHTDDVTKNVERILATVDLPDHVCQALRLAAKFHDLGKCRERWQRSIGNPNPTDWYAKSGGRWGSRDLTRYRHEFGSLLDIVDKMQEHRAEFAAQPAEVRELALHFVAAHHGRGRPHFPADEAFDPDRSEKAVAEAAAAVPGRFARLQRRYGRWGLAYLESLLRAADIEASVRPSEEVETKEVETP